MSSSDEPGATEPKQSVLVPAREAAQQAPRKPDQVAQQTVFRDWASI